MLSHFKQEYSYELKPVSHRDPKNAVPKGTTCNKCCAPAQYLYFNDGKKRSQMLCKICNSLSQLQPLRHSNARYECPYCNSPLRLWKKRKSFFIFKCYNNDCPAYTSAKNKLNYAEKILFSIQPFQFKLRYQFKDYHFSEHDIVVSSPEKKNMSLLKIRNSLNVLGLALTFHISFALSARKTALILRQVFKIKMSYQTVLNYSELAAYYCHMFNLKYKGSVDNHLAGDEVCIKIKGKKAYTFFFVSVPSLKITSYEVDNNRDTLPACRAINESVRTADPQQKITCITDGNPAYQYAIHFLNKNRDIHLDLKKVIGLQNLDPISEEYRPFKQTIERLNRTYRFHSRSENGFKHMNGARAISTLFVTHYNFLRPHYSLRYKVPVPLDFIQQVDSIQGQWAQIIDSALNLQYAA